MDTDDQSVNALLQATVLWFHRPKVIVYFGIVAAGVIAGALLQNELIMVIFTGLEGLVLLTPLTLFLGIVALILLLRRRSVGNLFRYVLLVGIASISSLICFVGTGSLINRWKVDAVEAYVSRAAPVLDRIKSQTGAYPADLPVDLLGKPPYLLSHYGSYEATSDSYSFEYIDEPAGWAGGEGPLEFKSSNRKWTDEP